jgi:hypothetical protein
VSPNYRINEKWSDEWHSLGHDHVDGDTPSGHGFELPASPPWALLESDMEQLLDRHDVTVFLVPSVWERRLRSAPWVRVFGNLESAVFVRTNDAGALAACAGYHARLGVPFFPSQGFDPKVAISATPDWAREFRLIPR